jgi:hypothetical protein
LTTKNTNHTKSEQDLQPFGKDASWFGPLNPINPTQDHIDLLSITPTIPPSRRLDSTQPVVEEPRDDTTGIPPH